MSKKTLLVVDDSPTALMMNTMLLGRQPYNIVSAKDGQEAVEKAIASPPDLVVMDVMMPRMNGIEACRAIRQHEKTRLVPVILITTRGEEEYVAQGFCRRLQRLRDQARERDRTCRQSSRPAGRVIR